MVKVRVRGEDASAEQSVRLFEIYNTSHRTLLVLAIGAEDAVSLAHAANHVHVMWSRKDRSYPHASEIKAPAIDRRLALHADLLDSAISRKWRGTIHIEGEKLYVGHDAVDRQGSA